LATNQKALYELKREISMMSKSNYTWEQDISSLDKKIALLIQHRITLEEVMNHTGDINSLHQARTTTLKNKKDIEHYGQLFLLLQRETIYIATLARLVTVGEIDNLLQTVMFTLYGNQYDDEEEHLLLSMFQRVLKAEFDEATGVGNFLRANTALTRMMTTYTRRGPGQQYLKQTLTDILKRVTDNPNMILEINPARVHEAYVNDYETNTGQPYTGDRKVSQEQAAANPQIQAIIKPRLKKLDELASQFVQAIIESLNNVPYGIRWICKQIRELAREKFKDATREQVCSLIGGFFLLRFINPAVVTPQAFMLVDAKLSAHTRRNLTLLAKILQNLANNILFGGVKEFYMSPLNDWMTSVREKLNCFMEDLTRVDNLDDHLQLDKYLRLAKTNEAMIHISLNEMYFIHSLLKEHIDVLTKKSGDNALKDVLAEMGPAPPQLPRKDNENVELSLPNRFRGTETAADSKMIPPEQLYTETKYLLFTIIKSLPTTMATIGANDIKVVLSEAAKYATQRRDTALQDKVRRINNNCSKLVELGMISEADSYAKLRRDTVQEISNYEDQIRKTAADSERLKSVLKSIITHNEFLKEQYNAYKVYLVNVRDKIPSNPSTATASKTKDKKKASGPKGGPKTYSHNKLQEMRVIIESEVPEERRNHINFSFACASPGLFDVTVSYRGRSISELKLQLDDLLERQANSHLELETDFLKLNVNLLIYLLNKDFMS